MTAEGVVLIVGAVGAQLGMLLQAWKTGRAVGSPNGSGSVHDALTAIRGDIAGLSDKLDNHTH